MPSKAKQSKEKRGERERERKRDDLAYWVLPTTH